MEGRYFKPRLPDHRYILEVLPSIAILKRAKAPYNVWLQPSMYRLLAHELGRGVHWFEYSLSGNPVGLPLRVILSIDDTPKF